MGNSWLDSLQLSGFDSTFETSGNAQRDAQQALNETVVAPLAHLGLIRAEGDDAATFLHNLVSNDVNGLGENELRRAGFCTAKGRMLADFLIRRDGTGISLQLSADVLPQILKKLSMYVLRAKVKLSDATPTLARIGIAGSRAAEILRLRNLPVPDVMMQQTFDGGAILGLGEQRFEIVIAADRAAALWHALSEVAKTVGAAAWRGLDIASGTPLITAATSEQFVPQMVNFELIGGVSFKKGCYPGQEIVARTHYLGKVKRRMYRAHVDAEIVVGAPVYAAETGDQACGNVVLTAPAARGGMDLLLVCQSSCVASGDIHLGDLAGPVPEMLPLPYVVE